MKKGAEDLAHKETFKGYPDYEGYEFLDRLFQIITRALVLQ